MSKRVTVIIPTYNRAYLVEKACRSALNQTYRDLEVFVIDNGSTDNTEEVISRIDDRRLRYFKMPEPTNGPAGPRNYGIKISDSPYLAFLDSDDQWLEDKLEMQIPLFEKQKDIGLVYSNGFLIKSFTRHRKVKFFNKSMPYRGNVSRQLLSANFIALSSAVAKRECFDNCGLFDERFFSAADWELWLRFVELYKIDYVDRPLIKYLKHKDAYSQNRIAMLDEAIAVLEGLKDKTFWQRDIFYPLIEKEIQCNQTKRELFLGYEYILKGKDKEGKKIIYNAMVKSNNLNNRWKFYGLIPFLLPSSLVRKILIRNW